MLRCIALSLLSCGFLILETGLLRILAVTQWYHLAFLALSTALLGGGLGPVLLALRPPQDRDRLLSRCILVLPGLTPLAFFLFNQIPFEPLLIFRDPRQWAVVPLGYLLLCLPFGLCSTCVTLLFSERSAAPGRLYAFDLVGAALGAPLFLLLLPLTGGYGVVFCASLLFALAGLVLRHSKPALGWLLLLSLLLVLEAHALLQGKAGWLPLRITATKTIGKAPAQTVLDDPRLTAASAWGPLGRVDILRTRNGETLLLDGGAAACRVPGAQSAAMAPDLVEILATLRPRKVLVIGAGAGMEVHLALLGGAESVVAVEMNPLLFKLRPYADRRVTLVTDEARHYLLGSGERFDAILSAHTISNAALSQGGLALAESYALTTEAFVDYFSHLRESGFLFFTRPPSQLDRLYQTAEAAWSQSSPKAPLGEHTLAYAKRRDGTFDGEFYGALLVAKVPVSNGVFSPLRAFLQERYELKDPSQLAERRIRPLSTPTTDDRPFFNHRVPLWALGFADVRAILARNSRLSLEDQPVAEVTLAVLLFQVALLSALLFFVPLVAKRVQRPHQDLVRQEGSLATILYFFVLGLSYLLTEVALLMRLGLYLGQPAYAAAVVLSGMLLFSGLGAARSAEGQQRWTYRYAELAAGLLVLVTAWVLPLLMRPLSGAPFALRTLGAVALLAPMAYQMGRPFPCALGRLPSTPIRESQLSWAFASNSLASVVASLLALLLSMSLGLTWVMILSALLYLLAQLLRKSSD